MAAPEPADGPDPLGDDPSALAALDVRALVAVGEHDLSDFHAAARILAGHLGTEPVVIPGARHLAPLERPAEFLELLLGFLGTR